VLADLLVLGYDDSTFMSCTDPALTTMRQPLRAIANGPAR
jgi:DNA-binding LacI/PurR family transcriptional regulator